MNQCRPLEREECSIKDYFWRRYINLIKEKVIPYQWEILNDRIPESEPSHAIDNFKIAANIKKGNFYGEVFQDSDVYKWLEAVGNVLLLERNEELEKKADEVIEIIGKAQEDNGYLNTYFTIEEPNKKWTNILECHELYCAGHFIEGAISYYKATHKEKVLSIAIKLANHIIDVFGKEDNKLHGYPGHQEIEIALLKLYELVGEKRYLEMAKYFIDTRGRNNFFEEEFAKRDETCFWNKTKEKEPNRYYNQFNYKNYNQFHQPVREQKEATGHAVRAVYMYTAMADLASKTQDVKLLETCREIWNNITNKQMYITGGIGATHSGEAFTVAYDLPNDTNYAETCASIGLIFFAQKMLLADVNSKYADVIEQALYNTVLGGMNYEGNRFFYVNPLEMVPEICDGNTERHHVKAKRQKWFACACCPPNIARTIPSLWKYIYTVQKDTVYSHLFIGNNTKIELENDILEIEQETQYPWNGSIRYQLKTQTNKKITFAMRIPEWASDYQIIINGKEVGMKRQNNGYVHIEKDFSKETRIEMRLLMEPTFMKSNQKVHYNAGRTAIVRGPLVYCIEEIDNGKYLNQIQVDTKEKLEIVESSKWEKAIEIRAVGKREKPEERETLYYRNEGKKESIQIKAVPYFLWNNRGAGEMQVWMREL